MARVVARREHVARAVALDVRARDGLALAVDDGARDRRGGVEPEIEIGLRTAGSDLEPLGREALGAGDERHPRHGRLDAERTARARGRVTDRAAVDLERDRRDIETASHVVDDVPGEPARPRLVDRLGATRAAVGADPLVIGTETFTLGSTNQAMAGRTRRPSATRAT